MIWIPPWTMNAPRSLSVCVYHIYIFSFFCWSKEKNESENKRHIILAPLRNKIQSTADNRFILSNSFLFQKSSSNGEILIFILRNGSTWRHFLPWLASVQSFVDRPNAICRSSCAWTRYRSIEFDSDDRRKSCAFDSSSRSNFDRLDFGSMDGRPLSMLNVDSVSVANEPTAGKRMRVPFDSQRSVGEVILAKPLYNFLPHRPRSYWYERRWKRIATYCPTWMWV